MVIKKARLRGKLNGLKVPDDFLMKYTNQVFPGDVEIVGNVFVDGNIEVKGRVNGLDLSKDVVTRCGNHTITGQNRDGFLNHRYSATVLVSCLKMCHYSYRSEGI